MGRIYSLSLAERIASNPEPTPDLRHLLTPSQAAAIERGGLNAAGRRIITTAILSAEPWHSNRAIARFVGCDHTTVVNIRIELEQEGKIEVVSPLKRERQIIYRKKPVTKRVQEMISMLESGHDVSQVAEVMDVHPDRVRLVLHKAKYEIPKVVSQRGRSSFDQKSSRIMEETVNALVGVAQGLGLVGQLDMTKEQAVLLLRDVQPAMNVIKAAIRQLKEAANEGTEA